MFGYCLVGSHSIIVFARMSLIRIAGQLNQTSMKKMDFNGKQKIEFSEIDRQKTKLFSQEHVSKFDVQKQRILRFLISKLLTF